MNISQESQEDLVDAMLTVEVVSGLMLAKSEIAFDDLELKTSEIAVYWMQSMLNLPVVKGVINYWAQVPAELVSDELRKLAVKSEFSMLKVIDPKDCDDYLAIFRVALDRSTLAVGFVHADYQSTATIDVVLDESPKVFQYIYRDSPWVSKVITSEQIERASRLNATFMGLLPRDQVSQEAMDNNLGKGYAGWLALRGIGNLKLAAEYMKDGYWPESDGSDLNFKKPSTVQEAVGVLRTTKHLLEQSLNMYYLMNQPIEEVISLMANKDSIGFVREMYTDEELRPLMKTNRFLKGVFLEDELGL
jgi:hypothetical protein